MLEMNVLDAEVIPWHIAAPQLPSDRTRCSELSPLDRIRRPRDCLCNHWWLCQWYASIANVGSMTMPSKSLGDLLCRIASRQKQSNQRQRKHLTQLPCHPIWSIPANFGSMTMSINLCLISLCQSACQDKTRPKQPSTW